MQKTERNESLSRESLSRLTSLLLAICATLFATAAVLATYIVWDKHQLDALKGSLLAESALQRQLLANQPSDYPLYPHLDSGVSYVLNPDMPQATWKTGPDLPYAINNLGLRGSDIRPKEKGVKRIALVGDSVLFGWKIQEQEKLASIMQAMVDEQLGAGRYEFVTIALPGWNTVDQDRFLRSHLGKIAPDYIVWSIIRNDLIDSAGVVPPGMLAGWNAPQKQQQQPYLFLNPAELMDAPAHSIVSRWQANLNRIESFAQEHQIPVTLIWWREQQRLLFDYVREGAKSELPVVYIPGQYRYDEDKWCVAFPDCHPTLWANKRLSLGLLDNLMNQKAIGALSWDGEEQQIINNFQAQASTISSSAAQQKFMREQAEKVPGQLSQDGISPILFGVVHNNMRKNGILLLRAQGNKLALRMDLAQTSSRPGPRQRITLSVRTRSGLIAKKSFTLKESATPIKMELDGDAAFGLYEVEWQFDFAECTRPSTCISAKLLDVQLQPLSAQPE